MKMLHPFMPFITEEIWQRIQHRSAEEALTISAWPQRTGNTYNDDVKLFGIIQDQISAIRNIQAEMNLPPRAELKILIKPSNDTLGKQLEGARWVYEKLLPVETLQFDLDSLKPKASAAAVVGGTEIFIPLEGLIDFEKERQRIEKEIGRLEGFLKGIEKKLANEKFVENAPKQVVENERKKREDALTDLGKLKTQLSDYQ